MFPQNASPPDFVPTDTAPAGVGPNVTIDGKRAVHDLKNLLHGIRTFAELAICDLPDESSARPSIEEIRLAADQAWDLCMEVLARSGSSTPTSSAASDWQSVDVSAIVCEMTPLLEVSVSPHALLQVCPAEALPTVVAFPSHIRRLLLNLVLNASDALEGQFGTIRVTTRRVHAAEAPSPDVSGSDRPNGDWICLEVTDTGCGIEAENRARMLDSAFTTKPAGHGLGMASVVDTVRRHGGRIEIRSVPGAGTSVVVLFPCRPPDLSATDPITPGDGRFRQKPR